MKQGLIGIVAAALSISACGSQVSGPPEQSQAAAEYRFQARRAYEAILTESCGRDPALARPKVLADEMAAMRALEAAKGASPAGVQLGIARADVDYSRIEGGLGCWADDDPRFAARHVEMARKAFDRGLAELRGLEARLPRQPNSTGVPDAAEFRSRARGLIEMVNPQCGSWASPADEPRTVGEARRLVSDFRRRLDGTPYVSHFEMAAADVRYEQSVTVVECAALPTTRENPEAAGRRLQAAVQTRIAAVSDRFDIP